MSKLIRLKKYLDIWDSASYLSEKIGERLEVADLFEMSLLSDLQFSLYVTDVVWVRQCEFLKDFDDFIFLEDNIRFFDDLTIIVNAFYDLVMIGDEVDYLYSGYQNYSQGDVLLEGKKYGLENGFFIKNENGIYSVLEDYDLNPTLRGSKEALDVELYSAEGNFKNIKIIEKANKKERESFLKVSFNIEKSEKTYIESKRPPDQSKLMIKISELDRFANFLNNGDSFVEQTITKTIETKEISSRQKNTLLILLATMCKEANFDISKRGISKAMEAATEQLGVRVSDDTIRKVIKEMQEALESRQQ